MTVGNITQSTLYGITSASQMVKTTSSASSGYEELKSVEELIAQDDTDADGQLSIDETPLTEGWEIQDRLDDHIDWILDAGHCGFEPTTIIDLTEGSPVLVRAGKGPLAPFGLD